MLQVVGGIGKSDNKQECRKGIKMYKVVSGVYCGGSLEDGTFCGGDLEPGTFHGGDLEPGTFHRGISDLSILLEEDCPTPEDPVLFPTPPEEMDTDQLDRFWD